MVKELCFIYLMSVVPRQFAAQRDHLNSSYSFQRGRAGLLKLCVYLAFVPFDYCTFVNVYLCDFCLRTEHCCGRPVVLLVVGSICSH